MFTNIEHRVIIRHRLINIYVNNPLTSMPSILKFIDGLKAAFLMVLVQLAYAVVSILYKLVANDGMSLCVLVAYRYLFASIFMVPLAYFVERCHFNCILLTLRFISLLEHNTIDGLKHYILVFNSTGRAIQRSQLKFFFKHFFVDYLG